MARTEPWLRGQVSPLDFVRSQVDYSFQQAVEDAEFFTRDLSDYEINQSTLTIPSISFHLLHIVGSVDRLLTYARDSTLSLAQFQFLEEESRYSGSRDKLIVILREGLDVAAAQLLDIDPQTYLEPRFVGRRRIQTTTGNLLVHIAEHTQRHIGQLITTSKFIADHRLRAHTEQIDHIEPSA